MELTFTGSPYLSRLLDDVTRLGALVSKPDPVIDGLAKALLGLEGVNQDTVPSLTKARALTKNAPPVTLPPTDPRSGSWQDTLQLTDPNPQQTQLLHAREVCGIAAAAALALPSQGLVSTVAKALHVALTDALVAQDRQAKFRTFDVAVHDSGSGRIVYQPSKPAAIADDLQHLDLQIEQFRSQNQAPVILAATALYGLLIIQPFDAANGRVAVLTARHLLAQQFDGGYRPEVETLLAFDRGGFHDAIAQTVRRNDVTYWCERYAETCVAALRNDARASGLIAMRPTVEKHLLLLLTQHSELTVRELPNDQALLTALLDADLLQPIIGMHGLKYRSTLAR